MSNLIVNKKHIENTLLSSQFAILATEGKGQPHMSLIAITPVGGFSKLIFSTYRNTVKYSNLIENGKVAVLIENGDCKNYSLQGNFILTVYGQAEEIKIGNELILQAHLDRHPAIRRMCPYSDYSKFISACFGYRRCSLVFFGRFEFNMIWNYIKSDIQKTP